jgi:hypothetical protein
MAIEVLPKDKQANYLKKLLLYIYIYIYICRLWQKSQHQVLMTRSKWLQKMHLEVIGYRTDLQIVAMISVQSNASLVSWNEQRSPSWRQAETTLKLILCIYFLPLKAIISIKQNASGSTVDKTKMTAKMHMQVICYSNRDFLSSWLLIIRF